MSEETITGTKEQSWIQAFVELSKIIKKGRESDKLEGIKDCKWVDLWAGQTDTPWETPPFPRPATFISPSVIDVQDNGDDSQDLTIDFSIICVYESYGETNEDGFMRTHALAFGKYCEDHHRLLQNLNGEHFNDLTRVAGPRPRPSVIGSLIVYEQVYRSVIRDYSANPEVSYQSVSFTAPPEPLEAEDPEEPFYQIKTN